MPRRPGSVLSTDETSRISSKKSLQSTESTFALLTRSYVARKVASDC